MRTVVQTVRAAAGKSMPKVAARAFLSRCHWHCHFMQKLESEPQIEQHAFNRACDDLRPRAADPVRLQAWQSGCTGYPFVDACMRALKARGWITSACGDVGTLPAITCGWTGAVSRTGWPVNLLTMSPGFTLRKFRCSGLTGINTLRIYNPVKQGQDHDGRIYPSLGGAARTGRYRCT